MKTTYARLLRASLISLVAAAGFLTIGLVAQDVCGNPLACFESGQEGEIWQALTPFGETNDQAACTNSLHPDPARIRPLARQCLYAPHAQLMPPMLGQLMDPFMLAVDGERIYVSDQSNHRIQAFLFDGTPVPLAHPIGDGVPGEGPYPAYPADSRLTGHNDPITGVRLNSPDGIAVDAAHRLIVGDASGYVNVFNPDGSPAFGTVAAPQRLAIPRPFGLVTAATGIAVTPGTVVRGFGVDPQGDPGRIVVTDRFMSFVFIYDAGFNLIKQIPEEIPPDAYPGSGACVYDPDAPLGTFCTPVMAAIDTAGHIYVSEYDNNRIQVLDDDGTPISYFGGADLAYPWGIALDHHGRLVVADTENQRIAFFDLNYPNGPALPPQATFQFELDAAGTLNGYPTAVIEQVGEGAGLDPAGRILVTDTLNNRVQRFQLPDLAIINPQLNLLAGTGSFQVAVPASKAPVTFVGVSAQGVNATVTSINGVAPANTAALNPLDTALQNATEALGTTIAPGQVATYQFTFTAIGGDPVSFIFDAAGNGGATAADPKEVNGEAPCVSCVSTHTYMQWTATPPATLPATPQHGWFNTKLTARITATSSGPSLSQIAYQFLSGPEAAGNRWGGNVWEVNVSGTTATIDVDILSDGVSSFRYWAIADDGTVESSNFATVKLDLVSPNVGYTIAPPPNAAGWNNLTVNGTYVHSDARSGPVFTGTGTFSFTDEGRNQFIEQTATDLAGNVSLPVPSHYTGAGGRTVNIDMHPPDFTSVPDDITIPATGAGFGVIPAGSWDAQAADPDLIDPRAVADKSGSGVASITNPGTHQFPVGTSQWTFTATDAAGNSRSETRNVTVTKVAGSVAYAGPLTVQYGSMFDLKVLVGPTFATGSVTLTFDGGPTVAAVVVNGQAVHSMQALMNVGTYDVRVDYPGDSSVHGASTDLQVVVTPAPLTIAVDPQTKVYGDADPVFEPRITAGQFYNGEVLPAALQRAAGSSVGTYAIGPAPLSISSNYQFTFQGADLTVTPRNVRVQADPKSKNVGATDPPLTYQVTHGTLVGTDAFSGALVRDGGELPGVYRIRQGSLTLGSNYSLDFIEANFSIETIAVVVRPHAEAKTYGDVDPELRFSAETIGGEPLFGLPFSGSLSRDAGEAVRSYRIRQGSLALPVGYQLIYHDEFFTIHPKGVTVVAGSATKVFGTADPPLTATHNGFLAADGIVLSVSRAPGHDVGNYAVTAIAAGAAVSNYFVEYVPGNLAITPATVTVTPVPQSITYGDADPFFSFGYGPFPGGYSAASVAVLPVCGVTGAHTNAGTYAITCSGGTVDHNIVFSYGTAALNVARKAATLVVDDAARLFGAANPFFTAHAGGLVGSDSLDYTLATTAGANSNIGPYPITASLGTNDNYTVSVTNGTLTVNPAPVTVAANPKTKIYGQPNPGLDAVVTGEVPGAPVNYSLATTAATVSSVGAYPIAVSLGSNANYLVTATDSVLTIDRLPITITAVAGTMVYGNAEPALTFTQSAALVGGDSFSGGLARAPGTSVGHYPISQGTLTLNVNYDVTFVGANFEITRRDATLTANNAQKFLGAVDPALTTTPSGFLGTDGITFSATRVAGEGAGTYAITPHAAGTALANYNVTYVNGTFTIVLDNQPPVCAAATGGEIWPPNHKRFYAAPIKGVVDPDGDPLTIIVTGIWQDELIDSTGDGKFSPDGQGVGTSTAWVRAERNGHGNKAKGNGRVYEILFTATDNKGASCSGSVLWTVPHDKGQRARAIDDGVRYDSTGVIPGARDKSQIHQQSPTP